MNKTSHINNKKPTTATKATILSAKVFNIAENMTNKSKFTENKIASELQPKILAKGARTDEITECAEGLTELCEKVQLEWWAYIILAVFVFLVLLLLNFIVKKINDARMEERCARLYRKSSTCTQVQTTLIKGDYDSKKKVEDTKSTTSALTGVSLIFTKSDNDRFSTNTSNSTALRIVDCGEAFRNARSLIDSIYEDTEFSHIIHRDSNTLGFVQNKDDVEDSNDIEETKQASGDGNTNTAVKEIATADKETSDAIVDSDGNAKNTARFDFEAIRKSFEVLGNKKPIFLKKQFHAINTNATKNNDEGMVNSNKICRQTFNDNVRLRNEEDSIKNNVGINDETKIILQVRVSSVDLSLERK